MSWSGKVGGGTAVPAPDALQSFGPPIDIGVKHGVIADMMGPVALGRLQSDSRNTLGIPGVALAYMQQFVPVEFLSLPPNLQMEMVEMTMAFWGLQPPGMFPYGPRVPNHPFPTPPITRTNYVMLEDEDEAVQLAPFIGPVALGPTIASFVAFASYAQLNANGFTGLTGGERGSTMFTNAAARNGGLGDMEGGAVGKTDPVTGLSNNFGPNGSAPGNGTAPGLGDEGTPGTSPGAEGTNGP